MTRANAPAHEPKMTSKTVTNKLFFFLFFAFSSIRRRRLVELLRPFAFFARAILFSTSSGVIFTKLDAKTSICPGKRGGTDARRELEHRSEDDGYERQYRGELCRGVRKVTDEDFLQRRGADENARDDAQQRRV